MKLFFESLAKHPISVAFYLFYIILCTMIFISNIRYDQWLAANPGKISVSYGEGIMYGIFFLVMTGAVFGFVLLINAIVRKQSAFYLWLVLVIIIQTVTVIIL